MRLCVCVCVCVCRRHYAMGHWWECMGYGVPSERDNLTQDCLDAHIQVRHPQLGIA